MLGAPGGRFSLQMPTPNITLNTTMGEILAAYPAAKLGLFRRYHIGGCTACGYKLEDTLGQVRLQYNIKDSLEAIVTAIHESSAAEAKLLILPTVLASLQPASAEAPCRETQDSGAKDRIIDVRTPEEFNSGHIPGAQLLTVELTFEALDSWPKDTPIVFYSNTGKRGLERASYFMAYGFTNVRNMAGGLASWPGAIDRSDAGSPAQVTAAEIQASS